MGLAAVTETAQMFQQKNIVLTERTRSLWYSLLSVQMTGN